MSISILWRRLHFRRGAAVRWVADETTNHNVRCLCNEVAWAGIAGGIVASFLSIFALRLGASAAEVGLLTTGPALAGVIFPMPAARLVRKRWGKAVVVLPLALTRMVFGILVLVPLLPNSVRVSVLVAAVSLLAIPSAYFTTAFVPLLGKVLPNDIRARVLGVRSTVAGLTSTITVLAAGKVLDIAPFPINFQIIFLIALVTAQVSTYLVSRVRIPALNEQQRIATPAPDAAAPPMVAVRVDTIETADFWRHTVSAVVFMLGLFLPAALYPIVQVDKLHATNGWIGALATISAFAGVVCSPFWARAATRFGNRPVLVASGMAFAVVPVGAGLVPTVPAYILIAAGIGALMSGVNIALFQCLLDVAPISRQTHYTAMYSMIVNSAAAGGPLLGTFLLSAAGMLPAFCVSSGLVLIGSIMFSTVGTKGAGGRFWSGRGQAV